MAWFPCDSECWWLSSWTLSKVHKWKKWSSHSTRSDLESDPGSLKTNPHYTLDTHFVINFNSQSCSVCSFQGVLTSCIRIIRYVTVVDVLFRFPWCRFEVCQKHRGQKWKNWEKSMIFNNILITITWADETGELRWWRMKSMNIEFLISRLHAFVDLEKIPFISTDRGKLCTVSEGIEQEVYSAEN